MSQSSTSPTRSELSMLSAGVTPTSSDDDELLFPGNLAFTSSSSYSHFPKANIRVPIKSTTGGKSKQGVITSRLPVRLWLDLDILPILCCTNAKDVAERACSAARKCQSFFGHELLPKLSIGKSNEVRHSCWESCCLY